MLIALNHTIESVSLNLIQPYSKINQDSYIPLEVLQSILEKKQNRRICYKDQKKTIGLHSRHTAAF